MRRRKQRAVVSAGSQAEVQHAQSRGAVLFAFGSWRRKGGALLRAAVLAKALGADLRVLFVTRPAGRANVLFPQSNIDDVMSSLRRQRGLVNRTLNWCNDQLVEPLFPRQIAVRVGLNFFSVVAEDAKNVDPAMVVVSGSEVASGEDITRIVEAAGVPVLVARRTQSGDAVVAATDLSTDRVPALRHGTELGDRLRTRVVFMHNVSPARDAAADSPGTAGSTDAALRDRSSCLRLCAHALGAAIDNVVVSRADTPSAILEVSRNNEADIVVVGTHHRSWVDRVFGPGIAARVVEEAKRSVLIVPMEPRRF